MRLRAPVIAPKRGRHSSPEAEPAESFSALAALQQGAGNRAVAGLLQREAAEARGQRRKLVCWGAKGDDVSYLQSRLNRAPEVTSFLKVDGDFGAKTYAAVKEFQRAHPPLDHDGVVGELTWAQVEAIPDEPGDKAAMANKYFELGAQEYKRGRYGHAYDFFTQASELHDAPEFVFNRAQALRLVGGRRKEAIALYEQFLAKPGDSETALTKRLLGELRGPGKTGDFDKDSEASLKYFERAEAAHKQGRHGEAYDLLTTARELQDAPELVFNQAQALRRLGGRRTEAIALYEKFLANPGDNDTSLAKRLLAELRGPGKTGDFDKDSEASLKYFERAEAAHKQGRHGEAYDLLTTARELQDAPELVFNQAQALRLLGGRRTEAIALYEKFLANPGDNETALAKRWLDELKVPGAVR